MKKIKQLLSFIAEAARDVISRPTCWFAVCSVLRARNRASILTTQRKNDVIVHRWSKTPHPSISTTMTSMSRRAKGTPPFPRFVVDSGGE